MKGWSNSEIPGALSQLPEKRLLAAVLQRGISDFLAGEGDMKEGARLWIFDEEPTDAPLSFHFICEALDLDKQGLRAAVLRQSETVASVGAVAEMAM